MNTLVAMLMVETKPWNEDEWRRNHWRCSHGWLRGEQCESCNAAQEPPSEWAGIKAILDEYGLQAIDFVADFKAALAQPAREPVAVVHIKDGCLVGSHRDESKPFPDGQYGLWPITTSPLPAQEPLHWPPSFVITPEYLDKYLAELKNENKTAQARLERVKAILAKAEKYP